MASRIQIPREPLEALCRRYGVVRLAVFGSALTDAFGPGSDVDLLVEFAPGMTPGLGFVALQEELAALVGRDVDLQTYRSLSRYFRDRVRRDAEVLFDEAA